MGMASMDAVLNDTVYKLAAITELLQTPERASELSPNTFSGIRIMLEEIAKSITVVRLKRTDDSVLMCRRYAG